MLYAIDGTPAFRIELYENSVAGKWKNIINSTYTGDGTDFDHRRTFFYLQTKEEQQQELSRAIHKINAFLKKDFVEQPVDNDYTNQDFLNRLHIAFETLSGTFEKPTKFFTVAPAEIKEAVRDLNWIVHKLERNHSEINKIKLHWNKNKKQMRSKLTDEECELFQFEQKTDEVYLGYNELGKTYYDLWHDGLPIDYTGTRNSNYIGGDIDIYFSGSENIFPEQFKVWCREHNIDPYDKKHGLGLLPIGKLTWENKPSLTKHSKLDIIEGIRNTL